eukprot:SAG31_NODE_23330_length_506_cov_1.162162_1_plen_90_part_01
MDDRILSARDVRKLYPRAGGFAAAEGMGLLGMVSGRGGPSGNGVEYFYRLAKRRGEFGDFPLIDVPLPEVELTYSYPGSQGLILRTGTRG